MFVNAHPLSLTPVLPMRTVYDLIWENTQTAKAFHEIMGYMKPYEGILYRDGQTINDTVRFYDEHEWRYVPDRSILSGNSIEPSIQKHQYMNPDELADANRKLEAKTTSLSFDADDIKYIIIEDEDQINKMVKELRVIKGSRYDRNTVDRLVSRIITVEQIKNDF